MNGHARQRLEAVRVELTIKGSLICLTVCAAQSLTRKKGRRYLSFKKFRPPALAGVAQLAGCRPVHRTVHA